jgi:hypothetical protein
LSAEIDRLNLDNSLICTPGQSRSCWCNTGGPGQQACLDNGHGYAACSCTPDAGSAEDGGAVDAGVPEDAGASMLGLDGR